MLLALLTIFAMQFIQVMVFEDDMDKLEDRIAQNIVYTIEMGN